MINDLGFDFTRFRKVEIKIKKLVDKRSHSVSM